MNESSDTSKILIYGAYGYTGDLIAREAVSQGLRPVLAGRNEEKLKPLAEELGLPYQVFGLEDERVLDEQLKDMDILLHCAGPFSQTARPMAEACIRTHTHYLDITGEIGTFELMASKKAPAKLAGIMMMPGTGFDVVPSDCLAAHLKSRLPQATRLRLCIYTRGGSVSPGTAATIAENAGKGCIIRKEGKLKAVPTAWNTIEVNIEGKKKTAVSIPWGDVSTAWYSTSIPNIETYTVAHPKSIRMMRISRYFGWLINSRLMQGLAKKRINKNISGPDADARAGSNSYVWGEATDAKGNKVRSLYKGPNGYGLTAEASILICQKISDGNFKTGFQTPSLAYGKGLVLELTGTQITDLE